MDHVSAHPLDRTQPSGTQHARGKPTHVSTRPVALSAWFIRPCSPPNHAPLTPSFPDRRRRPGTSKLPQGLPTHCCFWGHPSSRSSVPGGPQVWLPAYCVAAGETPSTVSAPAGEERRGCWEHPQSPVGSPVSCIHYHSQNSGCLPLLTAAEHCSPQALPELPQARNLLHL